jgi:N utilization substance protein A
MRIKTFVVEVKKTTKGPQVLLSRTRTGLLKRLFELEVPEIQDGLVEIKSVAREPGHRSKMAVYSRDSQIDPVGACVGSRGIRVQMIVRELKGEKIDVIPWSADPIDFIINALSPAKVSDVKILPSKKTAIVIVPDFQLSLAIGKEGQNARLAAKLTGWKIDIKSESQATERAEEIERLVREEIGFRDVPKEEPELIEPIESIDDLAEESGYETQEMDPVVPQVDQMKEETELIEELHQPDDEDDEPEEFSPKKKVKKSKAAPKHLAKIELDDEPISLDDGYFFADVLEERGGKTSDGKVEKPAELEKPEETTISSPSDTDTKKTKSTAKKAEKAETPSQKDDFGGFTIGQLLGAELTKEKKDKGRKKGDQ